MPPFDPAKDARNRAKHGVSLTLGTRVVADPYAVEALDDRVDYGEARWNVLGMVEGVVYVATVTERDGQPRFISVRPASRREADVYFRHRP